MNNRNVNKTLIYLRPHQQWWFNNQDYNSQDPTVLHNVLNTASQMLWWWLPVLHLACSKQQHCLNLPMVQEDNWSS